MKEIHFYKNLRQNRLLQEVYHVKIHYVFGCRNNK
jgi:hypothetical protein